MSTETTIEPLTGTAAAGPAGATTRTADSSASPGRDVRFTGLLASERIKLLSLRSTWWTAVVIIGLSAGIALLAVLDPDGSGMPTDPPVEMQRAMIIQIFAITAMFTQLAAVVLGALSMTGEYATGMIRSTMTASPSRVAVFVAKAVVIAGAITIMSIVSSIVAYFVAMPTLLGLGVTVTIADPAVMLAVLQSALYLVMIALFALGIGALLRSSAGAIAVAFAVILVLPMVLSMLPYEWVPEVAQYTLTAVGSEITGTIDWAAVEPGEMLRLFGTLLVWPGVALIGGGILLARRDV